jgi:hypothetical protein
VNRADSPRPAAAPIAFPLTLLGVLLVYALSATYRITLPGIYMDAVNPDYLVAKVLNRAHAEPLIAWVLPGNYLADRFPILVSLYHGLQQFWLGLPLYAVFGTSVVGIRLTHMVFAMAVLVGMLVLLKRARVPIRICALCGLALALDPAFIFTFRTQSYITMSPVAWLLFSVALLVGADDVDRARRARQWLASGVCFGFAVLGYFVYAFYLPALLLWMPWLPRPERPGQPRFARLKECTLWLSGAAFGCAYYALGYALVAHELGGGLSGFLHYLAESAASLGAFATTLSFGERVSAAASFVESVFTNGWHQSLMFGSPQPTPLRGLRLALMIVLPVLLLAFAERRHRSTPLLRLAIGLPISFFAVSLLFGSRLGGHHYMSFLPISYVGLAAGFAALRSGERSMPPAGSRWAVLCFVAVSAINLVASQRDFATLDRTGGVGLYSNAINRLATDVSALSPGPFVYFPDWGLSLPVILISEGSVPAAAVVNADEARRLLCSGRDVAIAIVGDDRLGRFSSWAHDFQWESPHVTTYRQRDGAVVAQLGVFSADRRGAGACGPGAFRLDSDK